MIWLLAFNAALGIKHIWYHYGILTGTIIFCGIHVQRILTVYYNFKGLSNVSVMQNAVLMHPGG